MNVVIICGGRRFKDDGTRLAVQAYIRDHIDPSTLIMTGGADGTDTIADQEARDLGRQRAIIPANWVGTPGRSGGYKRNELMLTLAQAIANQLDGRVRVVAFPGDVGTRRMLELAWRAHVEYRTVGWAWTPPRQLAA